MRLLITIISLTGITLIAACKKDTKIIPPVPGKQLAATLKDSASFIMNGKSYVLNSNYATNLYTADANLKIDSVVKGRIYYITGSKDTAMSAVTSLFTNDNSSVSVKFTFCKKFNRNETGKNALGFYLPKDLTELYKTGNYPYAVDYRRQNTISGVGIDINGTLTTYSTKALYEATNITRESEKDASFEVTKLTQQTDGSYLLEAKFNANVFDENEQPRKIEKGYLRLIIHI